jgi:hypothetical protein
MVRIREHKQECLTRHAVAAVLVCAYFPAKTITTKAMRVIVAGTKEAAP